MPFNYQAQPLPILTPNQMGSVNFSEALKNGLETYQQGMKSSYLPQNLQADLEKKQAYAEYMKNMPMQYTAQVLGNPQLTPYLSNEQKTALVNSMIQRANTQQNPQLHTKEGLWNWIKNISGYGSNQPASNTNIPQQNNDAQQIANMQPGDSYVSGSGKPPVQTPLDNSQTANGYTKVPPPPVVAGSQVPYAEQPVTGKQIIDRDWET